MARRKQPSEAGTEKAVKAFETATGDKAAGILFTPDGSVLVLSDRMVKGGTVGKNDWDPQ